MNGKNRRFLRLLLLLYLAAILSMMFIGFGRLEQFDTFHFQVTIHCIPLWFPKRFTMDILYLWIFSLGNLAAFLPFGILLPLCFSRLQILWRALLLFLLGITCLELLQMLTRLGSFDLEDILVNTLGFLIGYGTWRIGRRGKSRGQQIVTGCACAGLFTLACIAGAELLNRLVFR